MARSKQYAERVNILKKVRVGGVWKLSAVLERNGKIVRDHVLISGDDEHHPEGGYYLEWYQEGKRRRQAIGDFSEVLEAARRKSIEVNAQKAGIIEVNPEPESQRVTIGQAIDEYLDFIKAHRKRTNLRHLPLHARQTSQSVVPKIFCGPDHARRHLAVHDRLLQIRSWQTHGL